MTARSARLVLAGLVLLAPVAAAAPASAADGERITDEVVSVRALPGGDVLVTERITYDFGDDDRHGIERTIPTRERHDQTHDRDHPLTAVQVSSPTGAPADVERSRDGDVTTLRIGDPDRTVTGVQTYVLTYRVGAMADARTSGATLVWDAIGTGWDVPVDRARVTLIGDGLSGAACVVGSTGSTSPCTRAGTGWRASGLARHRGMTVSARTAGPVEPPVLVATYSPARAFGLSAGTVGVTAVLSAALLALLAGRRRRDDGTLAPVGMQSTPPAGARPGQLGALLDGRAGDTETTATLVDLAVRGHLRIEEVGHGDERDWRLVRLAGAGADRLLGYEESLLAVVFRQDDQVLLSTLRAAFLPTRELKPLLHRELVTLGWARGDVERARLAAYGSAVLGLLATLAVAAVLMVWTTWALVGAPLVLAGLSGFVLAHRHSVLTPEGERVRRATEAFRDYLRAPAASRARVDHGTIEAADRADLAWRYLPYATALGVEERWRKGQSLPAATAPTWYAGAAGSTTTSWTGMGEFSSTASSHPAGSTGSSSAGVGAGSGGGGGGSW